MLSGSLTPLTYRSSPESRKGTSIELRRYPFFSLLTGRAIIRISLAKAITASNDSLEVLSWAITSAVLFFQIELAKCSERYLSGRPVCAAKVEGRSVEELVQSMVFAGISGASA